MVNNFLKLPKKIINFIKGLSQIIKILHQFLHIIKILYKNFYVYTYPHNLLIEFSGLVSCIKLSNKDCRVSLELTHSWTRTDSFDHERHPATSIIRCARTGGGSDACGAPPRFWPAAAATPVPARRKSSA